MRFSEPRRALRDTLGACDSSGRLYRSGVKGLMRIAGEPPALPLRIGSRKPWPRPAPIEPERRNACDAPARDAQTAGMTAPREGRSKARFLQKEPDFGCR